MLRNIFRFTKDILETYKAAAIVFFYKKKNLNIVCNELFITHTFGGGTKTYENNYILSRENVVVLRNVRGRKTRYCVIETEEKKIYISTKELNTFFDSSVFKEITVNSIVPYTNYKQILKLVTDYKDKTSCVVRYMVHDFHAICPNFTLIVNNSFCNFECEKNNCKFCVSKHYVNNIMISTWRASWGRFLSKIDEVRVFSNSSKIILQNIYNLTDKIFNIKPHDMSYCDFKPYKIRENEPRRIAFVGTCDTVAKGNKIINDFIEQNIKYEICLLGKIPLTKKASQNTKVINSGSYKQSELPMLMEKFNVAVVIFPSICPETFSYIVSELIQLNVLILAFDIGAQREKIKIYEKGYIIKDMSATSLMEKLGEINGLL